jgi:peptidoglycan LD-endopeptidase LytH
MGPRGIPVRAITSGVWRVMSPGASAGLWGILRADNGDHFWYLHLDSHTVASGTRVSAGQQVGTNGSTGNAVAGAEHVHFEQHVGGSRPINPYPLLRSACG